MVEYTLSSFLPFIGKAVKDEYGRIVGNVISFTATPIGFVESVLIGSGSGNFEVHPIETVRNNDSTLILISPNRARASYLGEQLRQLTKKLGVLDDLKEKKTITDDAYTNYHTQIEQSISKLESEAGSTISQLHTRIVTLEDQLRTLRASFLDVEIARGTGEFENTAYETAVASLTTGIRLANAEKEDLENLTAELKSWNQSPAKTQAESPKVLEVSVVGETAVA